MAINLSRELMKSGYKGRSNKSFVLNKVNKYDYEDFIKRKNFLFEDPNTFLKLPTETNFNYIINKIPRGPQFDFDDKLIPYTMVGSPKYLKLNKYGYTNSSKSTSKKSSFVSRIKDSNFLKINSINSNYNIISDKEIKEIFNNYKNKIKENKTKLKDDLISKNECPKVMKQYIDKSLSLQEKCLKKNQDNLNSFRNMEDYIQQKMRLKSKKNTNKRIQTDYQNKSENKEVNISLGELIMNSGEEYRLKKEAKALFEKRRNKKYTLPNVNQNWEMSLRRPKNLSGIRTEYLNYGTQNYPNWGIAIEKNPQMIEHIAKPRKDFNYTAYGSFRSRANSLQNLFLFDFKNDNKTNDDILKNYIKKNSTYYNLEIRGQKLIDFEEDLCKKLKGKKKLLNIRNNKEEVKDITFHKNYLYNNFHNMK